jgi:hypothetical protein
VLDLTPESANLPILPLGNLLFSIGTWKIYIGTPSVPDGAIESRLSGELT